MARQRAECPHAKYMKFTQRRGKPEKKPGNETPNTKYFCFTSLLHKKKPPLTGTNSSTADTAPIAKEIETKMKRIADSILSLLYRLTLSLSTDGCYRSVHPIEKQDN
eukprot:TRINITY_DN29473_c0_g1_i1.p1 TRINITY_DN29473_c0_g1~~TRINITY_DN29473_c0_g1_i1.p1  ORF type:complete len:107 (+),score=5.58 TRINITY_DN29473_c0_g1_i1:299-619(+)